MSDDEEMFLDRGREYFAENGQPVWPARYRELPDMKTGESKGRLTDDRLIRLYVDALDREETMNRPSLGEQSAISKDLGAFSALNDAAELIKYAVRWAIDHQIGTALEKRNFVPLLPSQTQRLSEYREARDAVDSHRHERAGGAFEYTHDTDPAMARRIAINILTPLARGLRLPPDFIEALKALDYGEVYPMLEPAESKDQVRYREAQFQLKAVGFVAYQVARGMRIGKAQIMVADAFGVSPHTLRGWEALVRQKLGELEVSAVISRSQNYAASYTNKLKKKFEGDAYADPENFDQGPLEHHAVGKMYKRFLGFQKMRD